MAKFVNVDRETPMLLPPDLREWVADDDMVHFVIEAVAMVPLCSFHLNRRGSGSAQYPPHMMLSLLIYCYANGIFSSRRIERATYRDVSVRYLSGNTHPDHDTIAAFRRNNQQALASTFLRVLQMARETGLLKLGTVSVDGTHILANASKDKNVRYDRAAELDAKLELNIKELLDKAEQADQDKHDDGQSLPKDITRRQKLRERMQQARQRLEQQAKERAEAAQQPREEASASPQEPSRQTQQKPPRGKAASDTPADHEQINLTDADSKLMRKNRRSGYQQVYNVQAVVDAEGSQLIVGGHVSTCANDANELTPALQSVPHEAGEVKAVLADRGYVDSESMQSLESTGLDLYVSVGREEEHQQRNYDYRPQKQADKPPRPLKNPYLVAMGEKLKSEEGRKKYRLRKQTVEPVFGIIKHVLGFRQFLLRGLEKVSLEWTLVRLAYNLKRLWTLKSCAASPGALKTA